jgi:orotidine-5'-phosphate decarboxylase
MSVSPGPAVDFDPAEIRGHIALPLDVDDLDVAIDIATRVKEFVGVAKVGIELYAVAGPRAFDVFHELGYSVFADLKMHDIPTTVERAARVVGGYGVEYLNFHAAGGEVMLHNGATAYRAAARAAGVDAPKALGVTVLTSDADASAFPTRLRETRAAGCDGVVCSALEVATVIDAWPDAITMVPGIRLADDDVNDQARVATPEIAARAGAACIVVGRPITRAADPVAAAARVAASYALGWYAKRGA